MTCQLIELGGHRRVAFGEVLNRKVICLVVGEAQGVLWADQDILGAAGGRLFCRFRRPKKELISARLNTFLSFAVF